MFSRSVFDYATMLYEKSEGPYQNKLNHDINAILGSSDPPPGFGFLHPRVYYGIIQKRYLLNERKKHKHYRAEIFLLRVYP